MVVPSPFKNSLFVFFPSPPLAYARIDRFYFTAPLFSFNSYPGLIAFCRRPLRCTLMGIHLRSAIDVGATDVTCEV